MTPQIQSEGWQPGASGIYFRLPASVYHKAPGFSHSLSCHLDPPMRLPHYLSEGIEATTDMILGTLCHHRAFEPDVPFPQIAIHPAMYPGFDGKTPKDKKWTRNANYCKEWEDREEALGKIVLSEEEMAQVDGMVNAILNNPDAEMAEFLGKIIADCDTEVSIFQDAEVQIGSDVGRPVMRTILRKARLDLIPRTYNFLFDLKTVPRGGASKEEFQRKLFDMSYFTQAASNLAICRDAGIEGKDNFLFGVVEREPPFVVAVYALHHDSEALKLGALLHQERMQIYARCASEKQWPGYRADFEPIDLSDYAARQLKKRLGIED